MGEGATAWALAVSAAVLFLLLLIRAALNGLSAMDLTRLADEDEPAAGRVRAFRKRRLAYQLTLQFGLLFAGIAIGLLATVLAADSGLPHAHLVGFGSGAALVLVLGALAHLIAAFNPERVFLAMLPLARAALWVLGAFTLPLAAVLTRQLRVFKARSELFEEDREEEEITALLDVGQSEGILEKEDSELIRGVMEFGDTVAREVMTPRMDMVTVPANAPLKTAAEVLAKARHTRLPAYDGQIDNIVGVAYLKDFLAPLLEGEGDRPVSDFLRPVPFVPENKRIADLLREFQEHRHQMAVVVDEYGGVDGLVTTEDLIEEIVGEIQELGEAEEEPFREVAPGVVEALGRASIDDLAERLGVDLTEGDYDSVAGWVVTALGTIPHAGERLTIEGLGVEVLSADRRRIHRVRVTAPAEGQSGAPRSKAD